MAKARKEGKPKKNRSNVLKNLKRLQKNQEILDGYKEGKQGFTKLKNIYK